MTGFDETSRKRSDETNRATGRAKRYAQVGTGVGGIAIKAAGKRLFGMSTDLEKEAAAFTQALGGLKGPIMKIAQMLATIPDLVPAEYATELQQLQSNAPPMGWPFVKRRMVAELGPGWQSRFDSFEKTAAAAASLGQVHRAVLPGGAQVACKLQYPDMQSAVQADLNQLKLVLAIYRRLDSAIDPSQIALEVGARLREELDYELEACHTRLYGDILAAEPGIRVPGVHQAFSSQRLLTLDWLDGEGLLSYKSASQETRNRLSQTLFRAWWHPFSRFGAIHGDPHLGNYSVYGEGEGINLLDYGCIRTFQPRFVSGVVDLYTALLTNDEALCVQAYETWGFEGLTRELVDALNIWARFIYSPMLEDRVRSVADGIAPSEYGRAQAFEVHKKLKELGPVRPPREFVFMDRAAIGLGAVFLHLRAELNFHQLFNEAIKDFSIDTLGKRQSDAFAKAGVPLPTPD